MADHPNHCRCGALEWLHQSVEPKCGLVEAFKRVDPARRQTRPSGRARPHKTCRDDAGELDDRAPISSPRTRLQGTYPQRGQIPAAPFCGLNFWMAD